MRLCGHLLRHLSRQLRLLNVVLNLMLDDVGVQHDHVALEGQFRREKNMHGDVFFEFQIGEEGVCVEVFVVDSG